MAVFRRTGRRERKTIWEMILIIQARDGVAYCFPSQLFLPVFPFRGKEVGRRGGHGKGEGGRENYSRRKAVVLPLLIREAGKPQKGAVTV